MDQQPHFYDVAQSTIEQSHVKGYSTSGWYFFTDDGESEVKGPLEDFESAEAARVEYRAKGKVDP